MKVEHVVDSGQFSVPELMELFDRTREMARVVARGGTRDYENRILATLFYAPSTRTRLSFEAAMHRLGGRVISSDAPHIFSSEVPGGDLEDTVRSIGTFCDAIVLRHHEEGGADRAVKVSPVPIINAGDGQGGRHPTQALLDLYTIFDECGTLEGLSVALIGALDTGRTARSLARLLSKFDRVKIHFIAPPEMQVSKDVRDHLEEHGVWYDCASDPAAVLPEVDVVYQTRIDRSRLRNSKIAPENYNITPEVLNRMRNDAIILHPLPRSVEIDPALDTDPRAAYFRQATAGLLVRMALLTMIFDPA